MTTTKVAPFLVEPDGQGMSSIADLLETGDVEVVVPEVFAFKNVADAHEKGQQNALASSSCESVTTTDAAGPAKSTTKAEVCLAIGFENFTSTTESVVRRPISR